jgi:outer membrane protein assembly factor BamD
MSERDPKATRESYDTFKELVAKFPESKYAADARARMAYLVNALSDHEAHVARYYYRRGAYVAAANRAQTVLTKYPNAGATRDALIILADSYERMGMNDLRDDTRRVYAKTFPGQPADATTKSWWKFWQ